MHYFSTFKIKVQKQLKNFKLEIFQDVYYNNGSAGSADGSKVAEINS